MDYYHWLSLTTIPGEDRESEQAQHARSPNPCPPLVLRPEGFALPGPLRRAADPNSPRRIANPDDNRSAMGMFPSADPLICCAAPDLSDGRTSPQLPINFTITRVPCTSTTSTRESGSTKAPTAVTSISKLPNRALPVGRKAEVVRPVSPIRKVGDS